MPPGNFDLVMRPAALCSKIGHLKDIRVASNSGHLQMRGQKREMTKRKKERKRVVKKGYK